MDYKYQQVELTIRQSTSGGQMLRNQQDEVPHQTTNQWQAKAQKPAR